MSREAGSRAAKDANTTRQPALTQTLYRSARSSRGADNYGFGRMGTRCPLQRREPQRQFSSGLTTPAGVGGGRQTRYSSALIWYPNRNIRFMLEFLHGNIAKNFSTAAGGGVAGTRSHADRRQIGCGRAANPDRVLTQPPEKARTTFLNQPAFLFRYPDHTSARRCASDNITGGNGHENLRPNIWRACGSCSGGSAAGTCADRDRLRRHLPGRVPTIGGRYIRREHPHVPIAQRRRTGTVADHEWSCARRLRREFAGGFGNGTRSAGHAQPHEAPGSTVKLTARVARSAGLSLRLQLSARLGSGSSAGPIFLTAIPASLQMLKARTRQSPLTLSLSP